jgi:3-oxoacyl-[acyl-carrier protein] reductase
VASEIAALGQRALPVEADVSSSADVTRMIADINRALGPVDVLVNNAGIALPRTIDDLSEDDFDRTVSVNLKSAFLCIQAVLPHMLSRKWGRIVNISSGAARGRGEIGVHDNAANAGLEGLTRGYAMRVAADGVTVNSVAPSLISTEMVSGIAKSAIDRVPVGRLGRVEEVAQATLMVIANEFITGQTIPVNGGKSLI